MVSQTCPKCGSAVAPTAVVCAACDCILDMSFLEAGDALSPGTTADEDMFGDKTGADILEGLADEDTAAHAITDEAPLVDEDVEEELAAEASEARGAYGGEAIILGNIGDTASDFESMLSEATSSIRLSDGVAFEPVPVYLGQDIQSMIAPDAVLALRDGANRAALQLSPFEQHVLSFIDGKRPVARIRKKAGLGVADLKIAIGMLADRKLITVKGHIKPDVRSLLDAGELDDSGEFALPPLVNDMPPRGAGESVSDDARPVGRERATAPPPSHPSPSAAQPAPRASVDLASRAQALQVFELALANFRLGERARALSYLQLTIQLDPTNDQAHALIQEWATAGEGARSEAEHQVLAADAQRAEGQGQYERATELYRKAIALKPDEPELRNRLGILFALFLKDYSSATNELMKACELAPDNLAYRSNLGKIFRIADGGPATKLHAGTDSDALREAARAAKRPAGFLDTLRGGKK